MGAYGRRDVGAFGRRDGGRQVTAALDCLFECAGRNAINLENGGGGQAFSLQAGLEAFHLLGGESVKPVPRRMT